MTQIEQQNVPSLRFPGFDSLWKPTKLAKMGETVSGLTYSPNDIRKEGLLVLRSSNVKDSKLVYDDCVFVRPNIKGANLVKENDILICVRNGSARLIGKNAVIPKGVGDVAFGAFMTIFRPSADGFVHQLLHTSFYKKQVAADLGARINSINNSQLKKYSFKTPTLPEQRKIAGFLGAVDERIAQVTRKKALLEDYKKGCMQQLFSQSIRFKDDQGNDFPDWEEKRLGDIAQFSKGKGISKADISEDGTTPCIRYGEIYTHYREHITEVRSATNATGLFLSRARDVIIPASGEDPLDMARACCVEDTGIALGGDINVLRGAENGVFLAYYLNNAKRKDIARYPLFRSS